MSIAGAIIDTADSATATSAIPSNIVELSDTVLIMAPPIAVAKSDGPVFWSQKTKIKDTEATAPQNKK